MAKKKRSGCKKIEVNALPIAKTIADQREI